MKQLGRFSQAIAYVVAASALLMVTSAEATVGRAVVRLVRGSAQYSQGGEWMALKVGQVLRPGATVQTFADSTVDLFLDQNGPLVRVTPDTMVAIDKLNFEDTGVDTVVETQLDLKSGRIMGIVSKMAAASRYEVKTPNGVAGIRGTEYDISVTGVVRVTDGSVVVVFQGRDGKVHTEVLNAGDMFVPADAAKKPIPADELRDLLRQFSDIRTVPSEQVRVEEPIQIFVSPTTGASAD